MNREIPTGRAWFLALILTAMIVAGACTRQATPAAAPVEPEPTAAPTVPEIPDTATETAEEQVGAAPQPFVRGLDDTPLYGGSLVVPRWPDFPTCNPTISTDLTVSGVLGNVFDGLVRHNADLELQPELAESWEMSDDGMTITFYLREDVVWHDGVPFTSADVKFSFDEALSTLHPRGRVVFSAIESIDTPDDFTVIFNMSEPKPAFMYQINTPETMIIPKHIYENEDLVDGPHATCQELPVGTGPFKAIEYVPGQLFRVERNDEWYGSSGNYWGVGQPYLDEIIFVFISDGQARVNGLESG
jgi:peptide/nickel transport system substrate-binding protein